MDGWGTGSTKRPCTWGMVPVLSSLAALTRHSVPLRQAGGHTTHTPVVCVDEGVVVQDTYPVPIAAQMNCAKGSAARALSPPWLPGRRVGSCQAVLRS